MIDRDLAIDRVLGEAKLAGAAVFVGNGNNARVAYSLGDGPEIFYMLGSMGNCPAVAAGFSAHLDAPIVCIEGDGNALMGISALPAVARCASENFAHVILDNGLYETTGGQRTLAEGVDFVAVALACGYQRADTVVNTADLVARIRTALHGNGPYLAHVRTLPAKSHHPRVPLSPLAIGKRFRKFWHVRP
jgi:phosphonopyruvate decarboxylase